MKEDLPLIIFVLAVVVVSLSYWWYRQKNIKNISDEEEDEILSEPKK
jgi:hypothetical protein